MITVFKYELGQVTQSIELPRGSVFLSAGVQGVTPVVWYQVDTDKPNRTLGIEVVSTGHEVPRGGMYLDTVQIGPFVWHLYEVQQ